MDLFGNLIPRVFECTITEMPSHGEAEIGKARPMVLKKKKKKSLSLLNRKGEIERESKGRLFSDSGFFKKGIYAKHGNFVVKLTTGREETFLTVLEISKSGWVLNQKSKSWTIPPPLGCRRRRRPPPPPLPPPFGLSGPF